MPSVLKLSFFMSAIFAANTASTQPEIPDLQSANPHNHGLFNAGLAANYDDKCPAEELVAATDQSTMGSQLSEERIEACISISPKVNNMDAAKELAAKTVEIIIKASAESEEVARYIMSVIQSPNFSIYVTDKNLSAEESKEPDSMAWLGKFESVNNKIVLYISALSKSTEMKTLELIKHEFWHAAQYERNRMLMQSSSGQQIVPTPFEDANQYMLLQKIFHKTYSRLLELMQVNAQINRGFATMTDDLTKKYGDTLNYITKYPVSTENVYELSGLHELEKYGIRPTHTNGEETYTGVTLIRQDIWASEKITQIKQAPSGIYKMYLESNSPLDAFVITIKTIFDFTEYYKKSSAADLFYTELDCYLHTSFPEGLRQAVMPEIEEYHREREKRYLALISKPSAEENNNPTYKRR